MIEALVKALCVGEVVCIYNDCMIYKLVVCVAVQLQLTGVVLICNKKKLSLSSNGMLVYLKEDQVYMSHTHSDTYLHVLALLSWLIVSRTN